jgi:DNA-binding response OmpR family regulator
MAVTAADILLVDDDQDLHSAVEMMLAPLGYSVRACTTGSEGLEAMRRRKPDLVLLDIMLAHPSEGVQVACQMRQDAQLKDVPIIFISSMGEEFEEVYAREVCPVAVDADMFLEKPLDAAMVREAVQFVLEKGAAPSE